VFAFDGIVRETTEDAGKGGGAEIDWLRGGR
jgi:hypothetical protein